MNRGRFGCAVAAAIGIAIAASSVDGNRPGPGRTRARSNCACSRAFDARHSNSGAGPWCSSGSDARCGNWSASTTARG